MRVAHFQDLRNRVDLKYLFRYVYMYIHTKYFYFLHLLLKYK